MNQSKKPLIIANWKMNPVSLKEAKHLFETVRSEIKKIKNKNVEIVFCPPFVWLDALKSALGSRTKSNLQISLGAQNVFQELKGAYTGEISPLMLKYLGCGYVIIGHSERRQYLGETDEVINQKIKTALRCGLKPILCVGEEERGEEEINLIVGEQLKKDLEEIPLGRINDLVIAYEPVWAISTSDGLYCSPDQAMKAGLFIKKVLTNLYKRKTAEQIRILYGGSVDSKNVVDYIKEANMDGVLVGGASLNASEFVRVVTLVNSCLKFL